MSMTSSGLANLAPLPMLEKRSGPTQPGRKDELLPCTLSPGTKEKSSGGKSVGQNWQRKTDSFRYSKETPGTPPILEKILKTTPSCPEMS